MFCQNCDPWGLECRDECKPVILEMKEHPCFRDGFSYVFLEFYFHTINQIIGDVDEIPDDFLDYE